MASPRLFGLKDIADQCGLSLAEFMIPCYYCSRWLTPQDKILYVLSDLLVVWKDDVPLAACQPCIRVSARLDFLFGFTRAIGFNQIGEVCSCDWGSVTIRCLICFRKLNNHERDEIVRKNMTLFVVKDALRSPCSLCRVGL